MKNFEDIKIIARANSIEENILFEYYITSEPLFSDEGEILARWDKKQPREEITIILDEKASEIISYEKACKIILTAFKENKFLKINDKQAIYRGVFKA